MAITVTDDCIGCESCVEACPKVFEMDDDSGHAKVKDPDSEAPCVEEAMEVCPVGAIIRE
jgi:ferredoxin